MLGFSQNLTNRLEQNILTKEGNIFRVDKIKEHFQEAYQVLSNFMADEANFIKIKEAGEILSKSINAGGKILTCGNGGSMCDAMHFAEELTGRYRENRPPLAAISLADASHISCTANDYGFESIFSRMVDAVGKPEDVLFAISTSGNSGNVLKAAESAKKHGMQIVALTGKDGGKLAKLADVEIRVPHFSWSDRIQEIHIKIIHTLIDYIEQRVILK